MANAINVILVCIGVMLFLFSEHQANRMTRHTRKSIRLAFCLNMLAGLCFVAQPFTSLPAAYTGLVLSMSGTALLIVVNRRRGCIFGCRPYDAFWRKHNEAGSQTRQEF